MLSSCISVANNPQSVARSALTLRSVCSLFFSSPPSTCGSVLVSFYPSIMVPSDDSGVKRQLDIGDDFDPSKRQRGSSQSASRVTPCLFLVLSWCLCLRACFPASTTCSLTFSLLFMSCCDLPLSLNRLCLYAAFLLTVWRANC